MVGISVLQVLLLLVTDYRGAIWADIRRIYCDSLAFSHDDLDEQH